MPKKQEVHTVEDLALHMDQHWRDALGIQRRKWKDIPDAEKRELLAYAEVAYWQFWFKVAILQFACDTVLVMLIVIALHLILKGN